MKSSRDVVELEQRQVNRKILRTTTETIYEQEDVKIFRQITDKVEVFLQDFLQTHLSQLRQMPDLRMAKVQDPVWFFSEYFKPRKVLKALIQEDLGFSDLFCNSLLDVYHLDALVFKHHYMIKNKLLLRDYPQFAEFPTMKEIVDLQPELDLPEGTVINKQAQQSGLYLMNESDLELQDTCQKLYITVVFDIGSGVEIESKFELDFLLSCVCYGNYCKDAYTKRIIQPAIRDTINTFNKQYALMYKTTQEVLQSKHPNTHLLKQYLPDTGNI